MVELGKCAYISEMSNRNEKNKFNDSSSDFYLVRS